MVPLTEPVLAIVSPSASIAVVLVIRLLATVRMSPSPLSVPKSPLDVPAQPLSEERYRDTVAERVLLPPSEP